MIIKHVNEIEPIIDENGAKAYTMIHMINGQTIMIPKHALIYFIDDSTIKVEL